MADVFTPEQETRIRELIGEAALENRRALEAWEERMRELAREEIAARGPGLDPLRTLEELRQVHERAAGKP